MGELSAVLEGGAADYERRPYRYSRGWAAIVMSWKAYLLPLKEGIGLGGGHTRRGGLPDSEMIMKDGRLE